MYFCMMDSYETGSMMKYFIFQGRIVALNSQFFLKNGGNFVISIKVSDTNYNDFPHNKFEVALV